MVYLLKILFSLEGFDGFESGPLIIQKLDESKLRHRIREYQYFPYYFSFTTERECTMQQYDTYMDLLRKGDRAFQIGEISDFMAALINKCIYEMISSDFSLYVELLRQVTEYPTNYFISKSILKLEGKLLERVDTAELVMDKLVNAKTQIIYLINIDDYLNDAKQNNQPLHLTNLYESHKQILETQIENNASRQISESAFQYYTDDIKRYFMRHVVEERLKTEVLGMIEKINKKKIHQRLLSEKP
jgi:hypothetical protein